MSATRSASSDPTTSAAANAPAAKRVGIRDIAQRSGVSAGTVSMVLNKNPKITSATAKKVQAVIEELDYRPNRIAQQLSGKYTRMLAVILPTLRHALADPYFGEILSGVVDEAGRQNHKVMIEAAGDEFIATRQHLELFERRFVDGVLCIGFDDRHRFVHDFAAAGRPALLVNNRLTGAPDADGGATPDGVDHLCCDYRGGARQAMTCLLQLGHTRIAHLYGSTRVHTSRVVSDVYEQAMGAAGLKPRSVDGGFTEAGGRAAAEAWTRAPASERPTAIFCGNDKMALGAMHAFHLAGIGVPAEVSIVGLDDIAGSQYSNPPLTTVHLPLYELGVASCKRLIQRVRGASVESAGAADSKSEGSRGSGAPAAASTGELATHLVLRGSTAIAPR